MLIISSIRALQSGATFCAYQLSSVSEYKLYDVSQFTDGKCLLCASFASSAQSVFVTLNVDCVTGSEKSPPGGETAPIIETEPSFSMPRGMTFPARS